MALKPTNSQQKQPSAGTPYDWPHSAPAKSGQGVTAGKPAAKSNGKLSRSF